MLRIGSGPVALLVIACAATACRRAAVSQAPAATEGVGEYRGARTWTVGRRSFWIDVPVALPPPGSAGAMSASTDGTSDLLFPRVRGARSVRVTLGVSTGELSGPVKSLSTIGVAPAGGGYDVVPSRGPATRAVKVPGAAVALYAVGEFIKREEPVQKTVRMVLQTSGRGADQYWYVSASATGPADHPLLERDGGLVSVLEKCVRSFSLVRRPVARLPTSGRREQVRPATIDAVRVQATGAPTPRDAQRMMLEALVTGDAAAWRRVVIYGYGEPFTKAYDDHLLATARLARAVRRKPIPGIESYVTLQQAIERSRQLEEALAKADSLPLPPRKGERVDGGATGGPMHLIERDGRFFIERFVIEEDPDGRPLERGEVHPWVQAFTDGWRASATAYDEAAALHLAGRFRDISDMEAHVERRRKELMPARPEADE